MLYNDLDDGFDFLTPEKLDIIYRYLEDQRKLVDDSFTESLTPSEASLSPVTTPVAEPISESGALEPGCGKYSNDSRALYNMFALPISLSNGSTELLSISQKSQGKKSNEKNGTNSFRRSRGHLGKQVKESRKNPQHKIKILFPQSTSKSGTATQVNTQLPHPNSLITQTNIKSKSQTKLSTIKTSKCFSKDLSKCRITLPKLERVNPAENAKEWLANLQFSERDFLGLKQKQRLVVLNSLKSNQVHEASSIQPESIFQTESHSRFFSKIDQPKLPDHDLSPLLSQGNSPPHQPSFPNVTKEPTPQTNLTIYPHTQCDFIYDPCRHETEENEPVKDLKSSQLNVDNLNSFCDGIKDNLDYQIKCDSNIFKLDSTTKRVEPLSFLSTPLRNGVSSEESDANPVIPCPLPLYLSTPFTDCSIQETLDLLQRPSSRLLGTSSTHFYRRNFSS